MTFMTCAMAGKCRGVGGPPLSGISRLVSAGPSGVLEVRRAFPFSMIALRACMHGQ